MKRIASGFVVLALLCCGPVVSETLAAEPPANFCVATDGKDAWSGRLPAPNEARTDGPWATLTHARDAIRQLKKDGRVQTAVTVNVRSGIYALPQGLKFTAEDGGTAAAPVVYRAFQNEKPILVGGKVITDFTPHEGKILKADVGAQGFRGVYFRQLIYDGQRQHLARYPNFSPQNPYGGGWAYADGKYIPMYQDVPGEDRRSFQYCAQDTRTWSRPDEVEVFVFARYNWWNNICRIKAIDRTTRQVTLASDASYPIRPRDRYYFRNALEELDAPGEWYLDKQTWTLYFWPPGPLVGKSVVAPTTRTVLELGAGTAHVIVRNFTIECAEGSAVVLNQTDHCLIAGNTIRNVGDYHGSGVVVNGGTQNGVVGNDLAEIGSHGISLSGGDPRTLTAAGNIAENNYIHHVGVFYKQGVGIDLRGVGNRAAHNLIHDAPRMGIMFGGNNLVIEYNHIRHVNLETADTGAVYTGGRDWLGSRGSVLRHNYFHDILGYGYENGKWVSPHYAWGVYLDDNTGGVDVIGNIVARSVRGLIHLHNGRDNVIENNIFVGGTLQQMECNGWTENSRMWQDHLPTMIKGYESVAGEPAWRAMRNMQTHPTKAVLPDGKIMSGNRYARNIICYRDPQAKYVSFRTFSFDHNACDHNLIWHFGQPILTGQLATGRDLSENLAPNPSFELGTVGAMPQDWQWQIRPTATAKAAIVAGEAAEGRCALRIDAAFNKERPRDNYPIVVSKELTLPLGHTYRLAAKMKATRGGAKANLMLQSYVANAYFWANYPNDVTVTTEWKKYEFTLKIPAPGEKGHHEKMQTFRIRGDFRDESGELFVDDVSLVEVERLDEWASWQKLGMDQHSVIADPRFVNPDRDDYRLQADSPAFKLGFQPIPVENIGPFADELRASWPIVEAPGAREQPLLSE